MKNIFVILTFIFVFSSCKSDPLQPPLQWKVGTSTSGFFTTYNQEQFTSIKSAGIDCLELSASAILAQSEGTRDSWCKSFKEKADNAGLEIWSVHLPYGKDIDPSSLDDAIRNKAIMECIKIIALCKQLSPKKYVVHASYEPILNSERSRNIEKCIASLKVLNEEVKKQGAQLVIEDLPRTCLGNTATELLQIVDAVGDGAGICFDSNHLLKEKPEEFVAQAGHLISTVHMSDYDMNDERHWLPGKGKINWKNVLSELIKSGYDGPFLFEVSTKTNPGVTVQDLVDCWNKLRTDY